ncbi:MAG: TIGR04211 family SH3 domain-containing protein [Colwellia sp.]|nr:TIGR04211 family SH3 domain-containing protein [Colwellia sp.]MCW9082100.1 TIGR04211 family SH3 domain-containing protein [Colwellia sp.]
MNIQCLSFKLQAIRVVKQNLIGFFILFATVFSVQAQENTQAFISDDLSIFMHAGPGTNYRILGTINAGAQIQTTGKSDKGYSEIVDDKNRITWVESKYITSQPGLRFVVADLNSKLASGSDYSAQLDGEINELKSTVEMLNQEKAKLETEFNKIQKQLKQTQSKVKDQDTNIKKQWFFNGAIVLGIGLILGLILPKFFARRRSSMDNWG